MPWGDTWDNANKVTVIRKLGSVAGQTLEAVSKSSKCQDAQAPSIT